MKLPQLALSSYATDSWMFPLGDDGYTYAARENAKYGAIVENTNFATRNLDLHFESDGITCFGVGAHRLYNAGVDLYRVGGSAAGAEVKAVADGIVTYVGTNYPGYVIVLQHTLPDGNVVYSLYGHLETPNPPLVEMFVHKGAVLGQVMPLTHTGNFPEFHPNGDNAHLHFEIRTFADSTTLGLPTACNAQYGPAGAGYVYLNTPGSFGYLDPLAFLQMQVSANKVYLPLMQNGLVTPACQEGQNLAQNTGFEIGALSDSPPWLQVSNRYAWNAPLIGTNVVREGQRSARLGGWDSGLVVDEELQQSVVVPANTFSTTWTMRLQIAPDNVTVPDLDDYFVLTFTDSRTGRNLLSGGGVRYDARARYLNTWFILDVYVYNMYKLVGRSISLTYTAWSDETRPTLLAADMVGFITYCVKPNGPVARSEDEGLHWEVTYTPLDQAP